MIPDLIRDLGPNDGAPQVGAPDLRRSTSGDRP